METQHAIAALGALAQETRLAIFRLLVQRGPEGQVRIVVLDLGSATELRPNLADGMYDIRDRDALPTAVCREQRR